MASAVDLEAVVRRMGAIFQEWGMLPDTDGDLSFTKCKVFFADEAFVQFLHSLQTDDVDVAHWICGVLRRIVKEHNLAVISCVRDEHILEQLAFTLSRLRIFQQRDDPQSLVKPLKELVDMVSMQENPVGHNELLRNLLLHEPKLPRDFLRKRILPILVNQSGTKEHSHFNGAAAFLKRLLCLHDAESNDVSLSLPISELLAHFSDEWAFRNPDCEHAVGARKDINKVGPMLRFWKHSHQAHFVLAQYQHAMSVLLGRLSRVRGEATAGGIVLRDISCVLQTLVADQTFRPLAHSEYYSGSSICSLCAKHLYEIAPRVGPGPVREEQVIAVRLKCDCRMHKSCKLAAAPVIGKNGRHLCPSCESAPAALWEANEGEDGSSSMTGSTWQQYYYDYVLCALPQCHGFAQRFGQQCLVHASNPALLVCSMFQPFKHVFRKVELQALDQYCGQVEEQKDAQPMAVVSEAARFHIILRLSEVFSCITFESLAQKLALTAESSGIELCAKLVRYGAIEAQIAYADRCVFFSSLPPSEHQSVAARVCRQLTQVSGGIYRQYGIAASE